MKKLSIFYQLFLSIFIVTSLCVLTFGILMYFNQKDALIQRTMDQLRSVNILKKRMVERRLRDDERFIWHFVNKVMLFDTARHFLPEVEFRQHKDFLLDFCKDYGHVDVLLLDEDERAVDSLFQGDNYGEDEYTFVRVFMIKQSRYRVALVTSTKYLEGQLFENSGMGNTGESYLVGPRHRLLTKSRFYPDAPPRAIIASESSVAKAFEGKTGSGFAKDYRNIAVLNAHAPIQHKGLDWVLISEIDVSEAMQPVSKLRNILIFFCLFVLLVAVVAAYYFSRQLSDPIKMVSKGIIDISKGVLPEKMTPPFYDNEESEMKQALNRLIESFDKITHFASEIGKGNLKADFLPSETDQLGKSLLNMRNQLISYQEREILQRKQKTLALIEAQEDERRRIARDLHDGLGQWLTGIKLKLASVTMREDQKEELKSLVSETIEETRRITNNLMPNVLFDFGLDSALRKLVTNVEKAGLEVEYNYEKNDQMTIPFEVLLTLYRIAQEALNNIQKHAQAQHARLEIWEEENSVTLLVEDDGIGLPPQRKGGGHGLGNMEERAKLLNGSFLLENKEKGTRLKVEIPL